MALPRIEPYAERSLPGGMRLWAGPSLSYARKVQRQAGEQRLPFEIVGDLFFQAVAAARALDVDPELALREAANRFKEEQEA